MKILASLSSPFTRPFTLSLLALLALSSCMGDKGASKDAGGTADTSATASSPSAAQTTDGEILVGAVFPMTGPIASYGQESVNGIKLSLEKINAEGVNGKKIRLILEDNKGEPAESANAVRKLINVDKVHIVFGSVASSNTLAGAPIAQSTGVPLVTPASTNPAVTQKGDYIFRTCFTDDFQGVVLAKFARQSLNKKKALTIIDVASDYSRGLAKVFKKSFTAMGGVIVKGEFTYSQGDRDFRSLLRKVKRAAPEVVFVPGYYTEVGTLLRQAREEMGIKLPFLGGDGWDSPKLQELAGAKGIKGNYISSHFSASDSDPTVQGFVKEYRKKHSQEPGAMAALGHDGMLVLADALRRAKDLSHSAIKDALAQTQGLVGITGTITIDEDRNARKPAVILETTADGMIFKEKISP